MICRTSDDICQGFHDRAYLRQLVKDYLKRVPDATSEEKTELKAWVMSGHDPYDNPYSINERGTTKIYTSFAIYGEYINGNESRRRLSILSTDFLIVLDISP